jgi:hypothetical protein
MLGRIRIEDETRIEEEVEVPPTSPPAKISSSEHHLYITIGIFSKIEQLVYHNIYAILIKRRLLRKRKINMILSPVICCR